MLGRLRKGPAVARKSQTAPSTPRLSEFAQHFVFPAGIVKTVWPRVEAKGLELGLGFDWWQAQLGAVCLGYGADGKYCATVGGIGLSIPRQVGKTYFVLSLLVIMCVLFPGLQVVWTAHHLRTSTKTFTSLRGICRRRKVAPHVRAMRAANGEQQVEFVNGSMIMFGARSMGFGRGFDEIDVEVFDEAQILDTKALEDMIAATNQSRHEHGALLFFMGTPPRPSDPSEAFVNRRDKAITGKASNAVWLEVGADPESDPDDREQWARMNPSFPKRTPLESMLRLRENLGDDDSWNREGRGIWDPKGENRVIDSKSWSDVSDPASMPVERLTLAVDVAPDRSVAAVSLAGRRADGLWHVELYEHRAGADWVPAWVAERATKNELHAVVADELSGLVQKRKGRNYLGSTDVEVTLTGSRDMAIACAGYFDEVMSKGVRHTNQPQVNTSLAHAGKRLIGDSGWAWNKKTALSDITPTVSQTLALWGARNDNVKKPVRAARRKVVVLS